MAQPAAVKSLVTCIIAGTHYLIHPQKLGTIQETIKPDALLPVTLLDTHEIFDGVDDTLSKFQSRDDVFAPDFGFILVEKPGANSSRVAHAASHSRELYSLHHDGRRTAALAAEGHDEANLAVKGLAGLPSGPYFLQGPNLHQAWRLYDDTAGAFALGVVPENVTTRETSFRAVSSLSDSGVYRSIAVPSRLYFDRISEAKPLNGIRVAIPDSMALKGVPTSLSSRAWQALNPLPADTTAALAQRLMDLGAVIVGKTKSSQFASGREWVDEHAPWSPRGDGYQRVFGGAAGAGAAIASYEWLAETLAIDGIDGLGEPHALFSLRTTPGTIALNGKQTSSRSYDTVVFMGRTMAGLSRIASSILTPPDTDKKLFLPGRLVFPLEIASTNTSEEHQKLARLFRRALEKVTGHRLDTVNMTAAWDRSPPAEASGKSLHEYTTHPAFRSFCYEFFHEYDGFRKEYQDSLQQSPFAEATTRFRWETGKIVSKQENDAHQKQLAVFRKWFKSNISAHNNSSDGWTAVVAPIVHEKPSYKDEDLPAPTPPARLSPELLSWILQAPEVIVPFAHLPYESRISHRKEYRAVYGSVMGLAGGDLSTLHLVREALDVARWRNVVDTGPLAFPQDYTPLDVNLPRVD
ncbi:amidase signature domain-containing protein [Ophiocordyceps camponoti-floridani]|uniref:Amidase signature domain-containing protein n=1 Tax=Ophiocordyceps camponoti-floridani TaxID=2030778 RepID=A0A8H4QEE5_9HYPO|nr:amidase signature domain-containing protein [Ophiocordyceps camponoti-floridani]